jgi:hypothetical protein
MNAHNLVDSQTATVTEINRMQGEVESMVTTHILQEKAILDKEQQKKSFSI